MADTAHAFRSRETAALLMMVATISSCAAGSNEPFSSGPVINPEQWKIVAGMRGPNNTPLSVAVGPVRAVAPDDSKPWIQHDLILTNVGARPLWFSADRGCGYGVSSQNRRVHDGACALNLDRLTVPPKSSARRKVTLFKQLPVFAALTEGDYVFRKHIRFRVGSSHRWRERTLEIIYEVGR